VIAAEIAQQVGEIDNKPRQQIARIVMLCGAEFAQQVLQETLTTEAAGGLMTTDGGRRRTPGGVFFYLARNRMPDEERQQVFYPWDASARQWTAHEAQFPLFDWDTRRQILETVLGNKGAVSEVKINLIGRPAAIERRQNLVIVTMADQISETIAFPGGVPKPTADPVTYVIYIAAKQWERIAKVVEAGEDELAVDGVCAYDAEIGGLAVFATYATTRKRYKQEKKVMAQKEAAKTEGKDKVESRDKTEAAKPKKSPKFPKPVAESTPSATAPEAESSRPVLPFPTPVTPLEVTLPPGMPPEVARKLLDLHTAAATFRQKIADIQTKPDGQRFGLEITQKLLTNTERQIDELQKQYPSPS